MDRPHATNTPQNDRFPDNFIWGVATASYQVEGGVTEGGRGTSIWDTFASSPGKIVDGSTGDIACDHYHRYEEDVKLLAELGATHYRFSLAWPRLQPDGRGMLCPAGLDFYERLIDSVLGAGIQPWVTLYHWDLPQALEDEGGWPERVTADRFAEYAVLVHERLRDRVTYWTTLNEPYCSALVGYAEGRHAPGREEPEAALRAAHHLMLGHGQAVRGMREQGPDGTFGITLNLYPVEPVSDDPLDVDAARRVDGIQNRIFLDPVLTGRYPSDVLEDVSAITDGSYIHEGDEQVIAAPLDVLGVNYYTRHVVGAGEDPRVAGPGQTPSAFVGSADVVKADRGKPTTEMGWEIDPEGLREVLMRLHREYPSIPLYITENGIACADGASEDGLVHDQERTRYLADHFRVARESISDGVDLRGYFVWTFLDNFEWAWGYSKRFGIVYVDFETQQRIIKDSGQYFSAVAAANSLVDGGGLDIAMKSIGDGHR